MNEKLYKAADELREKYGETEEDIYYDLAEDQRRQSNYADIDWLKQLAVQMWNKRADMENAAATEQDSYRVLRYLQTILYVSSHLVNTAKSTGMDLASAQRYQTTLRNAVQGLASVPGLQTWSEWTNSFANSVDNYQPRTFYPRYTVPTVTVPMTITAPQVGSAKKAPEEEEEDLPLPPGLFGEEDSRIVPFPLGAVKDPNDPAGLSAYYPRDS